MQVSRFIVAGTNYDYQTDVIRIEWEEDRSDYRRLDRVNDIDLRSKLPIITFEEVFTSNNANADGTTASALWTLIEREVGKGNTVTFIPDTSISTGYNTNPPEVDVVTQTGGAPTVYETEKGYQKLRRSMTLKGSKWLSNNVTSEGNTIDDLDDLDFTLD